MDIAKEILLFANKAVTQQSKALKGERSNGMILTKKSD